MQSHQTVGQWIRNRTREQGCHEHNEPRNRQTQWPPVRALAGLAGRVAGRHRLQRFISAQGRVWKTPLDDRVHIEVNGQLFTNYVFRDVPGRLLSVLGGQSGHDAELAYARRARGS